MAAPGSRGRRAFAAVIAAGAVLLVTATTGCAGEQARAHTSAKPPPTHGASPSASPSGYTMPPGSTLVASAITRRVAVHASSPDGPTRWSLTNPNSIGAPLVFLVVGEEGAWWKVRVPARPNEAVGWVAASDVSIAINPFSVVASLSRRMLTVFEYNKVRVRYRIAVGRPSAPTPTGSYYLTELLEAPHPNGPYGPFAYGTSAFSDVFSEFEGGPGQIGVHGTNDPSSIGHNVSHGCIRLHNGDMARLAHLVPAGTPLTITA